MRSRTGESTQCRTPVSVAASWRSSAILPIPACCVAVEPRIMAGPMRLSSALVLLAAALPAQEPFEARVSALSGADAIVLDDERVVRLQGVSIPTPAVRPTDFVASIREWLRPKVLGQTVLIEPDTPTPVGESADLVALVRTRAGEPSLNEQMLARGLAVFSAQTASVRDEARLVAAAAEAQRRRDGWFARTPRPPVESIPFLNGTVLGLHHRERERTYERELDELGAAGFRHVTLIFSAFLSNVEAWRIERHHPRTVRDDRLIETIRYAREKKGMTVSLLPIVLLEESNDEDWRGTIRPAQEDRFWVAYDEFLSHYLDIAEATGVEMFSVGSEYGSLEDRTETWQRLIQNARGRFSGLLTYSANWDHVHVPRFFGALDCIGMTAYFSIADEKDPTVEELVEGWRSVGRDLAATARRLERPVFFTELGYASQDGISTDPWNYFIAVDDIDLGEQRDCFEAALRVLPEFEWLHGAFWFDYYGDGGRGDNSYTPRGKPAMEVWRRWAGLSVDRKIERAQSR